MVVMRFHDDSGHYETDLSKALQFVRTMPYRLKKEEGIIAAYKRANAGNPKRVVRVNGGRK